MISVSFVVLVLCGFAASASLPVQNNTEILMQNIVLVVEEVIVLAHNPFNPLDELARAVLQLLGSNVPESVFLEELEAYVHDGEEGPNFELIRVSVEIISWIGRGLISDCTINEAIIEIFSLINCSCQIDPNLIWIQIGHIPLYVNRCLWHISTFCLIIGYEPVEEIPAEAELIIQFIEIIINQLNAGSINLDVIIGIVVQLLHIQVDINVIITEVHAYCDHGTVGPNITLVQSILQLIQIVVVGVVNNVPSVEVLQQIIVFLNIDIKILPLISQQVDLIYANAPNLSSCQLIPLLCTLFNGGGTKDASIEEKIANLAEIYIEVVQQKVEISVLIEIIVSLFSEIEIDISALEVEIIAFLNDGTIGENNDLVNVVLDVIRILYEISQNDLLMEEGLRRLLIILNLKIDISNILNIYINIFSNFNFDISTCKIANIPIICDLFYSEVDIPSQDPSQEQYRNWIILLLQYIRDGDEINAIKIALTILNVTVDIDIIVSETLVAINTRRNDGPNREVVSKVIQILVWGAKAIQGRILPETLVNNIGGLIGVVIDTFVIPINFSPFPIDPLCMLSNRFQCRLLRLPHDF